MTIESAFANYNFSAFANYTTPAKIAFDRRRWDMVHYARL